MIGNSWEYCEDYDAGPTSSKELKSPSWCTLIMLTCDTIENHTNGSRMAGYIPELAQYHMVLEYKPGATNRADALSR